MRALLLAAGLGTRLRPLTDTVPKCMVPIHGRPLIDFWLELLLGSGQIDRVLVNTHYLSSVVREYLEASDWRDRIDIVYEPTLLGTAGTIKANARFFADGSALVAHADNLTDFDLADFIAAHESRPDDCGLTMLTFRSDSPQSCGIVELDDRGVVVGFHEKVEAPPGDLANGAVYILSSQTISEIASLPGSVHDFSTEVLPPRVGHIATFGGCRYHRDIGTAESLRQALAEFRAERTAARDEHPLDGSTHL